MSNKKATVMVQAPDRGSDRANATAAMVAVRGRLPRVGIVSKTAHSKGMVTALKNAGAKVVPLGGAPAEIPTSLDAVVVRPASCSKGAIRMARDGCPVVVETNGASSAVAALRQVGLLLTPLQPPTPEPEKAPKTPGKAAKPNPRKRRSRRPKGPDGPSATRSAPRLDSKGWLLRVDFPSHIAWVAAQIRANPAVANDWSAYTSACRRQRLTPSEHSWGAARTALRKEGMAIPMKKAGTTLEARVKTCHASITALTASRQDVARKRARLIDRIRADFAGFDANPKQAGYGASLTEEFKTESRLVHILMRGVAEALGLEARVGRSDRSNTYRKKENATRLTPAEVRVVAHGASVVWALEAADKVDGMGRVHHVPDAEWEAKVPPETETETEPEPEPEPEPESYPLARRSHETDRAWARALIDYFEGEITLSEYRAMAEVAAESEGLEQPPKPAAYHKAVATWRKAAGLPLLGDVRPTGAQGSYRANWMPPKPEEPNGQPELPLVQKAEAVEPAPAPVEALLATDDASRQEFARGILSDMRTGRLFGAPDPAKTPESLEVYEVVTRKRRVALRSYHLIEYLRDRGVDIEHASQARFDVHGEGAGLRIDVSWTEETRTEPADEEGS